MRDNTMSFMVIYVTKEPFLEIRNGLGETSLVPWLGYRLKEGEAVTERYDGGKWFGHLTSPSYLEGTEWMGPFETSDEAEAALAEEYDLDPKTGEPRQE